MRGGQHALIPSLSLESESAGCRCTAKLVSCSVSVVTMPSHLAHAEVAEIRVRKAERGDVDALSELEQRVFATDRLSRPSLRRFLKSPSAEVIVARHGDRLAGSAIVLFRPRSVVARLYSIAVAPHIAGRGVGPMLLAAAEAAAVARRCRAIRLEVHVTNHAAISRYRKSGYKQFARHRAYYEDGGDALRFEKRLVPNLPALAPPYFHQTTEFTCGPACIMMALGWADRKFKPAPAFEQNMGASLAGIIAASGVFTLFFTATEIVRAVVGGELQLALGRRFMERNLAGLSRHMIVCGHGRVGRRQLARDQRQQRPVEQRLAGLDLGRDGGELELRVLEGG